MNILSRISSLKQSISQRNPQFHDRYDLSKRLWEGSFATVYSCVKRDADRYYFAVKMFDRTAQKGLRKEFRGEVKLLRLVTPHEHCVQMLDSFESRKCCYIVMERCGMSVQDAFAKASYAVSELDIAHILKCMLTGIQHLHECGIVHRDLKPANLLLARGSDANLSNQPLIKICDLGLGSTLPPRGLSEICGTAPYMAPEMLLRKKPYYEGVDIWSSGVTAHLMLFGSYPYGDGCRNPKMVKDTIREGTPKPTFRAKPGFPVPSQAAIKFVTSLLQRDPELRPDAARALKSQYISLLSSSALELPTHTPSFGATLSHVHDLTRDEPAPETPVVRDLEDSNEDDSSDSNNCGETEKGLSRISTCESIPHEHMAL